MARLTINLVSRDNGVGLSTDMALLEGIFAGAGHDVQRVSYTARAMRRTHVAIFLELLSPHLLPYAARHVGVFNLEWFPGRWLPYLRRMHQLWAKSAEAHALFAGRGLRLATLTGFASRDLHDPAVPRQMRVLHLKGHSDLKGTAEVLEAWRRHLDLPPLTVVSATPIPHPPPGVTVLGRLPEAELVELMNRCAIHVCPSRSEGWGHYITEGMSVGATVITSDASPMNEHVQPERGFLVPSTPGPQHHLVRQHVVDPGQLADVVRQAAGLDADARDRIGRAAREHILAGNARFAATALDLLGRL